MKATIDSMKHIRIKCKLMDAAEKETISQNKKDDLEEGLVNGILFVF